MDESACFLMEKLRAKGGTYKAFKEYSKSLRMTLLEKRYVLEITEKNYLQECLDLLQQNIRVSTLPAIIERLEVISRHLGLKFMSGPSRLEWFISSDMFYVEVVLELNGNIKDVKIHHDGTADQQSCEEMKGTLENRDFKDFTLQLEGLISIYNLNADKIIKSQAFTSLQFLEADIAQLFELQSSYTTDPFDIIHKSNVGFVQKRRGGHPMKIIYFISPYDLLDIRKNTYKPLTMDVPDVDFSVSLCLESSSTNKLQTKSLVKIIKSEKMDENSDVHTPTALFDELTSSNSNLLPACFVMKLKERTPICVSIINQIKDITDIEVNKTEGPLPILGLIRREIFSKHSDCEDDSNIVTLPDQRHCYVMTDNGEMLAYVVQSIPFVHPSQISQILSLLRRQALFNSFIASCIRPKTTKETNDVWRQNSQNSDQNNTYKKCTPGGFLSELNLTEDLSLNSLNETPPKSTPADVIMFEVSPLSLVQITVSFEHPNEETLLTADLDLSDISNLRCNISSASEDSLTSVTSAQDYAARALQRSFSIPATMRALMRLWESLSETSDEEDMNESSANNDVTDSHETAENKMATESSKENGECVGMEFSNGVPIKLEKPDSCEDSMDGFSLANRAADFHNEEIFNLPNPAHGFSAAFDVDMTPVMTPTTTASNGTHNFDVPPIFLDNANEPTSAFVAAAAAAAVVKTESAEFVENAFFRNKSASDLFASKPGAIVIDSSSDSEPADANKETLADGKEPSPGSTSSEFSALTEITADLPSHHEKPPLTDFEMDPGMMEMNNLEDVQQFLKLTENKMPKNGDGNTLTSSSVLPDHVLPNFSINAMTSLSPATSSATQGSISSSLSASSRSSTDSNIVAPSLPPSTTITRIPSITEEAAKAERKKLKNADDKVRIEKTKKKRKRDDSPMGPPEKFRIKSDSLPKSLSVSVKPLDASITPRSPSPSGALRKYTMSPTQSMSMLGKVSPNNSSSGSINNNTIKKSGMVTSPGLSGSPKMGVSSVSPKQNMTSSPKSVSSGSSGKPSMSALKSAVTSPSSGSSKSNNELKKSYKDSSGRESKEKKSSNGGSSGNSTGHQSPKPKSAQTKLKQGELSGGATIVSSPQYEGMSAASLDPKVVLTQAKSGGKKMCLASVIDKLNKQQEDKCNNGNGGGGSNKSGSPTLKDVKNSGQSADAKSTQASKVSNEYMIKQHSSDGIKMTISNKSRKEQNLNKLGMVRNSVASGSGSPKHGNLKANSGSVVICKKSSSKSGSNMSSNNLIGKHSKVINSGGSSGGSSSNSNSGSSGSGGGSSSSSSGSSSSFKSSKSNHSPKMHSLDPNRSSKEKMRPSSKTHSSDKSIFSGTPKRSSPLLQQESGEGDKPSYKTQPPFQPAVVFSRPLDTNFQIPKISDRNKMAPGENDSGVKKNADGGGSVSGSADAEHPAKTTDTISPVKASSFSNVDDCKVSIEPVKTSVSSLYDTKTKSMTVSAGSSSSSSIAASLSENSLDALASSSSSQHQISSSCSLTTNVQQSNDSIKVNL